MRGGRSIRIIHVVNTGLKPHGFIGKGTKIDALELRMI